MALLRGVRERFDVPMVLVSHLTEEVAGMTEWTLRLEEGRLACSGPTGL